jgi:putative membrane protein
MVMKRTGLVWVAVAAVLITGACSKSDGTKDEGARRPSSEQPPPRPTAVGTGGAASDDVKNDDKFVHDIALMNMAEIELSRMALDKAVSSDIKSFAQRMIDEHDLAMNTLKGVVSGRIDLPAQLDEKHRDGIDDAAKKQGQDFDREYVKAMIESHQDLAARLESRLDVQSVQEWKTAAAGRAETRAMPDPRAEMADVKVRPIKAANAITMKINQWSADAYPVAQKHLDTARTLENAAKKRSTD